MRFLTLFSDLENVHLIKDVGMIPYVLATQCGYDSWIAGYADINELPYFNDHLKAVKYKKISRIRIGRKNLNLFSQVVFIALHSRSFDVLHLFHLTRNTVVLGLVYKILHPKGILYLKLDYSVKPQAKNNIVKRTGLFLALQEYFLKIKVNVLTIETKAARNDFLGRFPYLSNKLSIIPNGVNSEWLKRQESKGTQAKENLIICVGRHGNSEKNSEMLVSAIQKLTLGSWKVAFIGPKSQEFENKVRVLTESRSDLQARIILTGMINDREELYSWYDRAKVYCTTSLWESFGLAMFDALCFGCHVITTPVSSADEATESGRLGTIVNDDVELINVLKDIVSGQWNPMVQSQAVREYAKRFSLEKIGRDIDQIINSNMPANKDAMHL